MYARETVLTAKSAGSTMYVHDGRTVAAVQDLGIGWMVWSEGTGVLADRYAERVYAERAALKLITF